MIGNIPFSGVAVVGVSRAIHANAAAAHAVAAHAVTPLKRRTAAATLTSVNRGTF